MHPAKEDKGTFPQESEHKDKSSAQDSTSFETNETMDPAKVEDKDTFSQEDKDKSSAQDALSFTELIKIKQIDLFAAFVQDKLNALILPQTLVFFKGDEEVETCIKGVMLHRVFASHQTGQKDRFSGAEPDGSLYQGTTLIDIHLQCEVKKAYDSMLQRLLDAMIAISCHHKNISIQGVMVFRMLACIVTINRHPTRITKSAALSLCDRDEMTTLIKAISPWPVASVLEKLLEQMDLKLTDPPRCLGGGRLGSVFPVLASNSPPAASPMALKVVVGAEDAERLRAEFEINQQVAAAAPGAVVQATRFLMTRSPPGAGMLMEEVGSPVAADAPGGLQRALQALGELHRAGFYHGSARLDNLLECGGGRYKWCDLQRAGGQGSNAMDALMHMAIRSSCGNPILLRARNDVEALVRSLGHRDVKIDIDAARRYAAAGFSTEVIEQIVRAATNFGRTWFPVGPSKS
jgi:hypothetical protein